MEYEIRNICGKFYEMRVWEDKDTKVEVDISSLKHALSVQEALIEMLGDVQACIQFYVESRK